MYSYHIKRLNNYKNITKIKPFINSKRITSIMNMQKVQKVGTDQFYFDVALRQAKKIIVKKKPKDKFIRSKIIEIEKIKEFTNVLITNLLVIEKTFPAVDVLDPFYTELIDNNIGTSKLKIEISKIKGTIMV